MWMNVMRMLSLSFCLFVYSEKCVLEKDIGLGSRMDCNCLFQPLYLEIRISFEFSRSPSLSFSLELVFSVEDTFLRPVAPGSERLGRRCT